MFSESMLSMPVPFPEESEKASYLPALLAIGCAWLVALLRGVLGVFRHEGLTLDMGLTTLALAAIPLIIFCIWRAERRHAARPRTIAARRQRPQLVLISNH